MRILRDFLHGMAVAVVLTASNVWIEHTELGVRLRSYTYEEMHRWLDTDELAVAVVDISDLPVTTREDDVQVTSREALMEIVRALAQAGAAGVSIDIDLSPEIGSSLHPEDARFFDELLAIRRGTAGVPAMPVFVGVYRSAGGASHEWLGDGRYSELAADMRAKDGRIPTVPTWVRTDSGDVLWSLSASLFRSAFQRLPLEPTSSWRLMRANVAISGHGGEIQMSAMLVDTSAAERLVNQRVRLERPSARGSSGATYAEQLEKPESKDRVRDRVVLVGAADPSRSRDNEFFIPGRPSPYPGVYLHASAVQTFRNGYLREVTPLGTIVADLCLAVLVFGGIALIRWSMTLLRRTPPPTMALFLVLLLASVAIALVGGIFAAVSFRVMWDGLVFVALAAVFHLVYEVVHDLRHQDPPVPVPRHPVSIR